MKPTLTLHKALSMLLTAAMVLNMGLTPVFAEGMPLGASGLTDCHTEHNEDCGYSETLKMGGCTHEHGEDCGHTEGTVEQPCQFIPSEDTEASPSDATEHTHDESCGYAPATEGAHCTHEHNDTCGYGETTTVTPCTHTCEVCKAVDSGKQPEKDCTCEPADSGEQIHGKDCPLYTAPQQSEAVKALIAMVDALPNVANITEENKEATIPAFEAAAMAYEALSIEDKAVFEATEQYTKLMALRDVLYGIKTLEVTTHTVGDEAALTTAINDASTGDTIQLSASFTVEKRITFPGGKSLILDLNGWTLTCNAIGPGILVSEDAELVMISSAIGGKLEALNVDNPYISEKVAITNSGTLTVTNCTIAVTGTARAICNEWNGTIKSISNSTIASTGGTYNAIVNGGTITSITDSIILGYAYPDFSWSVVGNATLGMDLTIPVNRTLTIPEGATLTVADGATLTVPEGATLTIPEGATLTNNGTIVNSGSIVGSVAGNPPVVPNPTTHDIGTGDLTLTDTCGSGTCKGHTVNGTSTGGKILVQSGTHNVTLNGVRIEFSDGSGSAPGTCAFEIKSGATVNLTLTGDNTLKSGVARAGLEASAGATLVITEASTGSLTAGSADGGAGIGGDIDSAGGTITINGGTITATSTNNGAGIGGGNGGAGGTIIITGGTVTATGGSSGAGIGGGARGDGGNITINGNAVIYAAGRGGADNIGKGINGATGTVAKTGGIVLVPNGDGEVHGTSVTPTESFTIPSSCSFTIGADKTVVIDNNITVTNQGTTTNNGILTINGSIVNSGTITSTGTIDGTGSYSGDGTLSAALTKGMIKPPANLAYNGTAKVVTVELLGYVFPDTDYTVTYNADNINAGAVIPTVTPASGAKLTGTEVVGNSFTITKGASALGITTDKTDNTFTYGDSITFTAKVSIPPTKGRSAAVNTVDFYYNGTKLNSSTITLTESGGSGTASFTYNTADKKIPAGAQTITAEYGGSGNLNGTTQTVTVTLNKKPLTGTTAGNGKDYDGTVYFTNVGVEVASSVTGDTVWANADGTVADPNVGDSKNFTPTSVTLSGTHADYYSLALTAITGTVRIERIDPVITVETDKASELGGKDIVVTVKITNPAGATTGFPAASEITITPTNATQKVSLAQTGTTGVYTATYTLADYSANLKASFKATMPSATTNYNANTTGTTSSEVEILDKHLPTVVLTANDTNPTYGDSVTLTATVDKDGKTGQLSGKVQFKGGAVSLGSPVAINASGVATYTVDKSTLIVNGGTAHSFTAEFSPDNGSDFKANTSSACTITVGKANMSGEIVITGTPKFGETLTANTSALTGISGDSLGAFTYQWKRAGSAIGSETSSTYTVTAADLEKAITVTVTPANANYSAKTSGAVTPSKAASTVTITGDPAKTYDGTAVTDPATSKTGSDGAVTFAWYVGTLKLPSAPKDAGSYTVKAILAENSTHEGTESAPKEFVIEKAPLTIQSYTAEDKDYDGTDEANVSAIAFDGLQNGESFHLNFDYHVLSVKFAKADADTNIAVTGTVTLTYGAKVQNYKLASGVLTGQSAEIKAINPTYSVANQNIKIAKTLSDIQAATTATGVNSQAVAGTLTWSETSGGSALASYTFTGNAGGTKTLYWTFTPSSGNYKTLSGSTVFTLTEKEVPILTVSNMEKTYDGEAVTTVTSGTAKVGETTVAGTFAFDSAPIMKDANTYTVTVKFTPTDTINYETATTSITVTIKKAELTVKADNVDIVVGAQKPSYTATTTGLVNGETIGGVTFTPENPDTSTKGTFTITPAGGTISGGGNGNYDITYVSGTLAISPQYTITFDATGGTTATTTMKTDGEGKLTTLPTATKSGSYRFDGWFTAASGGTQITTSTVFSADATVFAHWAYTGGNSDSTGDSDNSGGSYTPPSTSTETEPAPSTQGEVKVTPEVDEDGNATLIVSGKDVENAIKKANNEAKKNGTEKNGISVVIEVNTNKALNSVTTTLTTEVLKQLIDTKVNSLTIKSSNGAITFDLAALTHLYTTAGTTVTVSSTKVNSNKLSAEAQKATGGRPVYDFKVAGGDKNITTFGVGKISIGIPYELQKVDGNGKPNATGTFENPGNLVGVYVDANGKLTYLAGTSYHAASKTMLINTTHLSMYGVAYKTSTPTFTDTTTHWAKEDIQFVAARGLLTGTSATAFSPNSSMTRAMFVTALGRLANADVSSYKTSSFNDVAAGSYYLGYVEWAAKNNIVKGVGDGKFAPDQSISRQEMAVMLQSYAKAIGYKLPSVHKEIVFTDNGGIGTWAKSAVKEMQMAGILMGKDGGKFDPTGTATRAEVSAMLRRFVELVANSETAEGWVQNDSGNWMYFEDGKAVTGKKKIDGTTYEFDQYGITALPPKDRRYTLYTVQKGDSFWAIASKHKVNIFELASLNGKTIFSVIHPGDELKIPQK